MLKKYNFAVYQSTLETFFRVSIIIKINILNVPAKNSLLNINRTFISTMLHNR